VGACNRVSPIEPARVTSWTHLIHLKVYNEESPGKRRKHVVLSSFENTIAVIFQALIPTLNAFQTSGGINL
jgi:hypothetical protein